MQESNISYLRKMLGEKQNGRETQGKGELKERHSYIQRITTHTVLKKPNPAMVHQLVLQNHVKS